MGYVNAGPGRFHGSLGDVEISGDVGIAELQAETNRLGKYYNAKGWALGPVPNLPLAIDGELGEKTFRAVDKTAELLDAFHGDTVRTKTGSKALISANKGAIRDAFKKDADDVGLAPATVVSLLMPVDYIGGGGKIGARAPQVAPVPLTFLFLGGLGVYFLMTDKPKKRKRRR